MEIAMRISAGSRKSQRRRTELQNHSEAAVATIWLVFYAVGLVIAVLSPFVSGAIEVAARIGHQ
jgi:hypothetical protein